MFVSAVWAAAFAIPSFAVLMWAWWYIPPISDLAPRLVGSPYHALSFSACAFAMVFAGIFMVRVPECVVRPVLFGEGKPQKKGFRDSNR
jgi:hypothetical protein